MRRDVAEKWITALESGLYPQAKGQLRTEKGLCCLGVLCSLHAEEHPEIAVRQTNPGKYLKETEVLPKAVKDWAGMRTQQGFYGSRYSTEVLSDDNDRGHSFEEIAKTIRKHVHSL
jgi:hypothetical protein